MMIRKAAAVLAAVLLIGFGGIQAENGFIEIKRPVVGLHECLLRTERELSAGNHLAGIYGSVLQIPDIPVDTSKQGLYRIEVHMDNPA